ncbi:MAG: hypothetical protein FWH02_00765 [Oscillospiraceae bacterium]|nr:hypothetical protein [Oscillospiraceae bacterium]
MSTTRIYQILCAVLISITLAVSISACQKAAVKHQNPLLKQSGNFDTTANIKYRDLHATATITRETPGACSVSFTSPASLADMSFVFHDGVVDIAYKGIGFTFSPNSLPGGAVAKVAVAAINKAMRDDGLEVEYTEGALILNGIMENGAFTLRIDPESGNLLKLAIPAQQLEIDFFGFNFLD